MSTNLLLGDFIPRAILSKLRIIFFIRYPYVSHGGRNSFYNAFLIKLGSSMSWILRFNKMWLHFFRSAFTRLWLDEYIGIALQFHETIIFAFLEWFVAVWLMRHRHGSCLCYYRAYDRFSKVTQKVRVRREWWSRCFCLTDAYILTIFLLPSDFLGLDGLFAVKHFLKTLGSLRKFEVITFNVTNTKIWLQVQKKWQNLTFNAFDYNVRENSLWWDWNPLPADSLDTMRGYHATILGQRSKIVSLLVRFLLFLPM